MTIDEMAALYARAFPAGRAWSREEFAALLRGSGVFAVTSAAGFAVGRAAADEAELLTIAVDPDRLRRGAGRAMLADFEAEAVRRGATSAFLEVAADNAAALGLYQSAGWRETGRRRGYYSRTSGAVDALIMAKDLDAR